MNLVLFEAAEIAAPIPRTDPRARHILDVLRRREGDTFDAGVVNGPRGKATLASISSEALELSFEWELPPASLPTTTLIVGLPRPRTARDILRDATTLGATCIHFVVTGRADANYAASTLWTSGEWRRHCLTGAAQAFDTRIPEVTWNHTLASALASLPEASTRIALDNYEASAPLKQQSPENRDPLALALGPERGWSPLDRTVLRTHGFTLAHLGDRVMRVETAVVAALAITRAG